MTQLNQVWKCEICGNIIEIMHEGADSLICCGQPMNLLVEQTEDPEKGEKHVPVIEDKKVKIGAIEHPMEEKHYITLIQLIKDEKTIESRKLYPGEKPEAEFCLENTEGITARELCNMHGLWTS